MVVHSQGCPGEDRILYVIPWTIPLSGNDNLNGFTTNLKTRISKGGSGVDESVQFSIYAYHKFSCGQRLEVTLQFQYKLSVDVH